MAFGIGRALFGLGYVLAPGRAGRGWVGEVGAGPQGRLAFRSIGARDLALGGGAALAALRGDRSGAAAWFGAHAIADLVDTVGTALASGQIPERGRNLGLAMAGGSTLAAAGFALALARD